MKTSFRKSFVRDLKKIKDNKTLDLIAAAIEMVENCTAISDLDDLKKLKGFDSYFRIRVGELRIGISIDDGLVEFVRCLHRKDIYRYFP